MASLIIRYIPSVAQQAFPVTVPIVARAFSTTSKSWINPENKVPSLPDFGNHQLIFDGRTNVELWRSFLVLQACAIRPLVANSYQLLRLGERVLGARGLKMVVAPFYDQFVAGNTGEDLSTVSNRLDERSVRLMLAPMMESDVGENHSKVFNSNLQRMVEFLQLAARHGTPDGAAVDAAPALCQAKVTGHFSADILEKISSQYSSMSISDRVSAVKWVASVMGTIENKDPAMDDQSLMAMLVSGQSAPLESTVSDGLQASSPFTLSKDDYNDTVASLRRIAVFALLAEKLNVVVAMDAEFTYVNPGINLITLALMSRHNMAKPLIWNTYQAYLKSTTQWLEEDKRVAELLGCCFGVKLVRGAYLELERRTAEEKGIPDPVHDSYADTSNCYNTLAAQEITAVHNNPGKRSLLIATHNEESARQALVALAQQPQLPDHLKHCCAFAQIYGMAENISVPLASSGILVYKSVPLGTVSEVLPYLARRANENMVVLKGARRERQLLLREIRDRIFGRRT